MTKHNNIINIQAALSNSTDSDLLDNYRTEREIPLDAGFAIEVLTEDLDQLEQALTYCSIAEQRGRTNLQAKRLMLEAYTVITEVVDALAQRASPEEIFSHPYFHNLREWISKSADMNQVASLVMHHIPINALEDVIPAFGTVRADLPLPESELLVASVIFQYLSPKKLSQQA